MSHATDVPVALRPQCFTADGVYMGLRIRAWNDLIHSSFIPIFFCWLHDLHVLRFQTDHVTNPRTLQDLTCCSKLPGQAAWTPKISPHFIQILPHLPPWSPLAMLPEREDHCISAYITIDMLRFHQLHDFCWPPQALDLLDQGAKASAATPTAATTHNGQI